jgi:hypothetical protein
MNIDIITIIVEAGMTVTTLSDEPPARAPAWGTEQAERKHSDGGG